MQQCCYGDTAVVPHGLARSIHADDEVHSPQKLVLCQAQFLSANTRPGNGGPLLQPKGQTSVLYR